MIWLDSGRDLSESAEGPWTPRYGARPWETYFYPVIVQQAVKLPPYERYSLHLPATTLNRAPPNQSARNSSRPVDSWRAAQNTSLLPFQYGSLLALDPASKDTLYALSELFLFVGCAEVQFLNLMQSRIEHELSFVGKPDAGRFHTISLLNLRYIRTVLSSHIQSIAEALSVLENRHILNWPRCEFPSAQNEAPHCCGRTSDIYYNV